MSHGSEFRSKRVLGGRYRVDETIASGGTSTVHRGRDLLLGRDVALKLLRPVVEEGQSALRPSGEAQLGAATSHHALTTVYDAGVHTGTSGARTEFIVMELVPGGDLRDRLLRGGLLWREARSLGIDLAEGLAHLHRHGILHRDVKPANVLLSMPGEPGTQHGKLTDFGISTIGRTTSEVQLGTAAYISPEQVCGEVPTERSDVYSLGLVLLESITGRAEYPGTAEQSAVARLRRDPCIPLDVPEPFAATIRAMTDGFPERRPAAAEVSARLTAGAAQDRLLACDSGPARDCGRDAATSPELDRYAILDWPPRHAFTAATTLAQRLLGAQHAFVSIAGPHGLAVASATRDLDLPAHLHTSGWLAEDTHQECWTIEDLAADERCRDDAVLLRAGARAFAGGPLLTRDGDRLGTLCVLDGRPGSFGNAVLADLATLSGLILHELHLRLASRRAVLSS